MHLQKTNDIKIHDQKIIVTFIFLQLTATLYILHWVLQACEKGLDFTDEGFYLNWISDPSMYKSSLYQFGFIYHILYVLFYGDIALIRQANVLLTFSLALVFSYAFLKNSLKPINQFLNNNVLMVLSLMIAVNSLIYFYVFGWLSTPSYNSLTIQALLLTCIGVFLIEKEVCAASVLGWIIIAIGGWVLFMAKIPSAGLLALTVIFYTFLSKKVNYTFFLIAFLISMSLILSSIYLIDGSLSSYLVRLQNGYDDLTLLFAIKNDMFRIDELPLTRPEIIGLFCSTIVLCISNYLILSKKRIYSYLGFSFILIFLIIVSLIFNSKLVDLGVYRLGAIQLWAVPISAFCTALAVMKSKFTSKMYYLGLTVFFIFLPYIASFGTGNNYWLQSQIAGIFWILAGINLLIPVVLDQKKWSILVPTLLYSQFVTVFLLMMSMQFPYRQPIPLNQNTEPTLIGISKSKLYLSKDTSIFFQNAQKLFMKVGLKPETVIIDMTGGSPGIIYSLGFKALGQPWIIGGYPGSDLVASNVLMRTEHQILANAWILVEPQSNSKISLSVLNRSGIDFKKNYFMALKLTTPIEMGGLNYMKVRNLFLYAPKKTTTT